MQIFLDIWAWLHSEIGANILLALFALSEALGGIEALKASSVYQLVLGGMKWLLGLLGIKKA